MGEFFVADLKSVILHSAGKRIWRVDTVTGREYELLRPVKVSSVDLLKKITPVFSVGQSLLPENEEAISNLSYNDLRRFSYVIVSKRVEGKGWLFGQKVRYELVKESSLTSDVSVLPDIPENHFVEYDRVHRRGRLVGKNIAVGGCGKWYSM